MRALLLFGLIGLFLSGCSNYRLGTGSELSFRTLYIAPVVNESNLPQAVAPVSAQLREIFLRDSRIILVNTPDEADAVLSVTLVTYGRSSQASQTIDTGLTRKFDLSLEAEVTLRDNSEKKPVFEKRKVQAIRQIFSDGGQLQAEYNSVPLLAEELAKNIRSAALDTW